MQLPDSEYDALVVRSFNSFDQRTRDFLKLYEPSYTRFRDETSKPEKEKKFRREFGLKISNVRHERNLKQIIDTVDGYLKVVESHDTSTCILLTTVT